MLSWTEAQKLRTRLSSAGWEASGPRLMTFETSIDGLRHHVRKSETTCMSSAAPSKNCPRRSPSWSNSESPIRTRYSATTEIPHCGAKSGRGLKIPTSTPTHSAIRNAPKPTGQQRNPDAVLNRKTLRLIRHPTPSGDGL